MCWVVQGLCVTLMLMRGSEDFLRCAGGAGVLHGRCNTYPEAGAMDPGASAAPLVDWVRLAALPPAPDPDAPLPPTPLPLPVLLMVAEPARPKTTHSQPLTPRDALASEALTLTAAAGGSV